MALRTLTSNRPLPPDPEQSKVQAIVQGPVAVKDFVVALPLPNWVSSTGWFGLGTLVVVPLVLGGTVGGAVVGGVLGAVDAEVGLCAVEAEVDLCPEVSDAQPPTPTSIKTASNPRVGFMKPSLAGQPRSTAVIFFNLSPHDPPQISTQVLVELET